MGWSVGVEDKVLDTVACKQRITFGIWNWIVWTSISLQLIVHELELQKALVYPRSTLTSYTYPIRMLQTIQQNTNPVLTSNFLHLMPPLIPRTGITVDI